MYYIHIQRKRKNSFRFIDSATLRSLLGSLRFAKSTSLRQEKPLHFKFTKPFLRFRFPFQPPVGG